MRTKYNFIYLITVLILYIVVTSDAGNLTNYDYDIEAIKKINKNGLYAWPLDNINGRKLFPFKNHDLPVIGVIDSGVDLDNQFLIKENIEEIILDTESSYSLKVHGTMVVGILIANGDGVNSPGGLIPGAKIISVQSGTDAGMKMDQLAKAINLEVGKGAKVINISHGSDDNSPELESAIKNALSQGVIIVASAGNEGRGENNYPAKFDGVIAVSALDKNNMPTAYTNFESTNIFAPGEYLLTTGINNNYTWFNGTSAATPIVTSVSSILKYFNPAWNSKEINGILLSNSDKKVYGEQEINILNVSKILDYLISLNILDRSFGKHIR